MSNLEHPYIAGCCNNARNAALLPGNLRTSCLSICRCVLADINGPLFVLGVRRLAIHTSEPKPRFGPPALLFCVIWHREVVEAGRKLGLTEADIREGVAAMTVLLPGMRLNLDSMKVGASAP